LSDAPASPKKAMLVTLMMCVTSPNISSLSRSLFLADLRGCECERMSQHKHS
jgi:hypothetical protein